MDEFVVHLDTAKTISTPAFAQQFLSSWLAHPLRDIRPERWGRGEPVRFSIASTSIEALVSEWCKVALMFKRISRPKMTVSISWRHEKGLDPKPYPWGLTAWISKNAGAVAAEEFFRMAVAHFEPAFASLTTQEDSREKHFMKRPHFVGGRHVGTAESFEGNHVLETVPGVYWLTYFGDQIANIVDAERLLSIPQGDVQRLGPGYLLRAFERADDIGSTSAREIEQKIKAHLGTGKFFDKQRFMDELTRVKH